MLPDHSELRRGFDSQKLKVRLGFDSQKLKVFGCGFEFPQISFLNVSLCNLELGKYWIKESVLVIS